jgi:hypothetical protein
MNPHPLPSARPDPDAGAPADAARGAPALAPVRWPGVLWRLLLAVALGAGSAWAVVRVQLERGGVQVGAWRTSTLAGSTDADLYTRAVVAVGALLALNRNETLYYLASTDSDGQVLRSRCRYRISGLPPPARWWSITAYAEDRFLFDAPGGRYSLNGRTAPLDAQGRFAFETGPTPPAAAAWLPTPGDRGLSFALRLYNPDRAVAADPATLATPRIERLGGCA